MATKSLTPIDASDKNKDIEYKLNLFGPQAAGDWTRAIHHELNIKRRTCTTFIPNLSATSDGNANNIPCGCKRLRREHSWDATDGNDSKWDRKKHTKSAYNNAYGYIPSTHAHYIRCDIETQPKILASLMYDVWKTKEPKLIMCIIGGAKYFKLNERLEREFIKGIIQAALRADGWIVTTGFKTGVVQLVGEAIHDHKVTNPRSRIIAIGCSKWGAAKHRESLILKNISNKPDLDVATRKAKNTKGEQELEPNHTHFLLLDDGTYFGYDIGDYRTRFVIEASSYKNENVPVVTVVVEGGPDTLTTIYKDLSNGIPVILIDGSGRVPNLLAKFLTRTESMIYRSVKDDSDTNWKQVIDVKEPDHVEKLKTKFHSYEDEIYDGLKEISKGSKTSKEEMDRLFKYFLYCLQPAVRSKIRIYSLDSDQPLDDTIFEAIIEAKQEKSLEKNTVVDREQLLNLALAWNAIEVAKDHIIKDDLNDLNAAVKEKLFLEALILDRPQFVNTFIKLNFDLAQIFYQKKINQPWELKWHQLEKLYGYDDKKSRERLYLLSRCYDNKPISSREDLDIILKNLIGDYVKSIYTAASGSLWEQFGRCCRLSTARVSDSRTTLCRDYIDDDSEVPDPEEAQKEVREYVYRDLFFWSILTNRIEMCKVIISHMQTRICAALIASKILKSFKEFATDNESKEVLHSQAEQFEQYAIESLKCCYNYDEEKACEIAIRRIYIFGGVSCLQVAVDADDKDFVGQPCCDQLLNNIWFDKMKPFQFTLRERGQVLLSIFTFGLLAPFLIKFRENKSDSANFDNDRKKNYEMTVNETEQDEKSLLRKTTRRLHSYGINYSDGHVWKQNCCSKKWSNRFRHLKDFHESPFIKFSYNVVSYIFFLLLFSYFLLFDFNLPTDGVPSIHWTEILVIIVVTTMLFEDVRQFLCQESRSIPGKFTNYFIKNPSFSLIRIGPYVLFYIGLILRFAYASTNEELSAAKIIFAYDLEIWYIRSLSFLGVARQMGPKLVMIRKMLIDLFFFIYIILIAMIGYGVASRSMYSFDDPTQNDYLTFDGRSIFRHILYPTYYLMYGATDTEIGALDQNPDYSTSIATQVLLAFHMLFVNVLLINLLIAMFSFTFNAVQTQTDLVWRYDRYGLIREYFDRPPLFPPFIIITHVVELFKLISRHVSNVDHSKMRRRRTKIFKMVAANREIDREWSEFESYATNLYARTIVSGQPSSSAALVPSAARQEIPQTAFDTMNTSLASPNVDVKAITDEIASIKRSVGDLRTYAEEMNRCMQWMMDAMERVKMSKEPKPKLKSSRTTTDLTPSDE
ncbi:unnamed protein product [Rotaria socialis]|uniref:Uncharacterized protein n=1 Tax=Rotaria socialis TaxID=392032 RepID=A0A820DDU8_9BILA|nr:unnamed protein product [Rotaria socialis]CAF3356131.1 unnamed protein product [Rotaria socialis]CAF4097332.1 unnamed protein product [Rotaria socialis]CAF4105358.1 unnamed protein product [Rotaria socialis]CAF4230597.1 unnamed protein product [Rotaria socialis]